MTAPAQDRLLITLDETAELLGIGRTLAYELAQRGDLPVVHLGRRRMVHRPTLEANLAAEAKGKRR